MAIPYACCVIAIAIPTKRTVLNHETVKISPIPAFFVFSFSPDLLFVLLAIAASISLNKITQFNL